MARLTAWEGHDPDGQRAVMLDRDSPFHAAFQEILMKLARYEDAEERAMNDKKLNCKNCKYKYCPFRGSDREIFASFCEDYESEEEGET